MHFSDESPQRRRLILSRLQERPLRARIYVADAGYQEAARRACLGALVPDLVKLQVSLLVVESREGRDNDDVRVLNHARQVAGGGFEYEHRTKQEELLWAPDAIAWTRGKDPGWRSQVEPLVDAVTRP